MMTPQQQMQPGVEPTAQLSVRLEAQQWNQVIAVLNDAPYRIAAPLIQSVGQQLQTQAQQIMAGQQSQVGNGLDLAMSGGPQ